MGIEMNPAARAYLSEIGRKGGAKSKRKLSKSEAREMAIEKWRKWRKLLTRKHAQTATVAKEHGSPASANKKRKEK